VASDKRLTFRITRRRAGSVADKTDAIQAVACIRFVRRCLVVLVHAVNRESEGLLSEGKHAKGNATGSDNEPKEPGDQKQLKKDPISTKEKVKRPSQGNGVRVEWHLLSGVDGRFF
jgi:hypothetical protein